MPCEREAFLEENRLMREASKRGFSALVAESFQQLFPYFITSLNAKCKWCSWLIRQEEVSLFIFTKAV